MSTQPTKVGVRRGVHILGLDYGSNDVMGRDFLGGSWGFLEEPPSA